MAVTQNSYVGDGSTTTYSFTFPYLKTSEIKASLDATVTTAFTTPTATTVQFNTAPADGAKIKIYRETDSDSLTATFYPGSAIKSEDLNDNFTQNLYATQEINARYLSNLGGTMVGDLQLGEDVSIKFEGATDNDYETTVTVTDPTADRTITLPNVTGTVVTTGDTGTVATGMIANDAIDGTKLADNAVNSEHYTDGSIDHEHLANDIIDGDNIQDDVINSEHIAAGALDTEHYAANSVDAAALAHTSVTAGTYTAADITVDAQGRLTAAASGTIAGSEIAADAIDGTKIADNAINSEHYTDGSIDREHLAADIVDGSKIADDSLNSEHYVAGSIDHEHLANDIIDGDNIQDDVINSEHIAAGAVDNEHMAANSIDSDQYVDGSIDRIHLEADIIDATKIADNAVTTDHIQDAELTTLAGMPSGTASILAGSTALTATTDELNILDNKSFRASGDGALTTTSDTEIPSSKVIANHVAAQLGTVGGFTTIATEVAFPATASQPAAGVIISISDAAGVVVNGSGVSTTGRTTDGTPATVTINSFPSSLNGETLASGVGLLVTSTGSGNTYTYHKLLAAETDVKQLSDDINDFNARYRVAGSAPGSNNDAGDLYFDTAANKMKVYNGTTSQWDDVASVGNFYINTLSSSSGTGGGGATFGSGRYRFTLSNPPTMAQQLIVSVNGVIQKPNAGSSQPSEGFAIDGNDIIFAAAPAANSDYFIVTQGSSVSIGTPSDNTVSTAKIQNQAVNDAKILDNAIEEVSLKISNAPSDGKFLQYKDSSDKLTWATVDVTPEGTVVKSTTNGNESSTKFLRADGDGTCSWQVPPVTDISGKANLSGATFTGDVVFDGETANKDITFDRSENWLKFNDETKVVFGTTANTTLFHNGTDLYIQNGAGDIRFEHEGGYPGLWLHRDGAIELYDSHAAGVPQKKLETTATGINVIGQINVDGSPLSAAPEVSLVADGAIAANKPVAVQSDGKIKEIKETISVLGTPAKNSVSWETAAKTQFFDALYIPTEKVIVIYYNNDDNYDYGYVTVVSFDSNGDDTRGNTIQLNNSTSNQGVTWGRLAWDSTNERVICVYKKGDWDSNNAQPHYDTFTVSGLTLTKTIGMQNLFYGTNTSKEYCVNYDPDTDWFIWSVKFDQSNYGYKGYHYRFKLNAANGKTNFSGSGGRFGPDEDYGVTGETEVDYPSHVMGSNSMIYTIYKSTDNSGKGFVCVKQIKSDGSWELTKAPRVEVYSSAVDQGMAIGYSKDIDKCLAVWSKSGGNIECCVVSVSGTGANATLSKGTTITVTTAGTWPSCEYDPTINQFAVKYQDSNNFPCIKYVSVNGTTATAGNELQLYSNSGTNATDNLIDKGQYSLVALENVGKMTGFFDADSNDVNTNVPFYGGTATNTLSNGFIGFSKAAINDTATGTIAVTGNTDSSQSGLTAGAKMYVQRDGTLKTTADPQLTVEAGLALSSTKLLIKG